MEDPKLYREMSQPHASRKAAADAADAFFDDLREIRKKHRIADVAAVIQIPYAEADGAERHVLITTHNGHVANNLPMLAQAFGAAKRDHIKTMELLASEDE